MHSVVHLAVAAHVAVEAEAAVGDGRFEAAVGHRVGPACKVRKGSQEGGRKN